MGVAGLCHLWGSFFSGGGWVGGRVYALGSVVDARDPVFYFVIPA